MTKKKQAGSLAVASLLGVLAGGIGRDALVQEDEGWVDTGWASATAESASIPGVDDFVDAILGLDPGGELQQALIDDDWLSLAVTRSEDGQRVSSCREHRDQYRRCVHVSWDEIVEAAGRE